MTNLSESDQFTYSTVRIECEYDDGSKGTGTGFFFVFLDNEEKGTHVPVVITNKHVINGAVRGRFIITKADKDNKPLDTEHYQMSFENFDSLWKKHPNSDVDLCAIAVAPILREAEKSGDKLFYVPLDKSLLPTPTQQNEFSALEEIIMVGYPNGIWDHINNKPILRKGVTATNPNFNYCGQKEILIDVACFPGSSGSPVFVFNEVGYRDNKGKLYIGVSRVILLGVLYAGHQHTAQGDIEIINIPTNSRAISISRIPNNLGLIIKSERILELENLFE